MAIKWSAFSSGSAISGTDEMVGLQSSSNVRWVWSAVKTYILGAATAALAIAAGKTVTISNTLTFTGTDSSSVAFGAGGTVLYNAGALGTPASGTLTNCTGFPTANLAGLGTGVATFLATPSSVNLAAAVTGETGTGALVFADTPTLVTPVLGAATGTSTILTGISTARSGTATPAAASAVAGFTMGSAAVGFYWGTGSPNTALTAAKGSFFIRTDGSGTNDRFYINTDGVTAWTAGVTVG